MTTGIYLLKFKGTNKVYIGQSTNIEDRYIQHISYSKKSKKMQEAFELYGIPSINVLIECKKEYLNKSEDYFISLYNSVKQGFNTLEKASDSPVGTSFGENQGSAKYTKEQYIAVLILLTEDISFKEISEITEVSINTIRDISCGRKHRWLKEECPNEYLLVSILRGNRLSENSSSRQGKVYPKIINKDGKIMEILTSVSKFCIDNGIKNRGNFNQLILGKKNICEGWKVYE